MGREIECADGEVDMGAGGPDPVEGQTAPVPTEQPGPTGMFPDGDGEVNMGTQTNSVLDPSTPAYATREEHLDLAARVRLIEAKLKHF